MGDLGINRFTWGSMLEMEKERGRERERDQIIILLGQYMLSTLTVLLLPSGLERNTTKNEDCEMEIFEETNTLILATITYLNGQSTPDPGRRSELTGSSV